MKKGAIIAVAIMLALIAATGVMLATKNKDSPPVRIVENAADNNISNNNNELIISQNAQIAALRAQLEELERKLAQQEFDYSALKAEKDKLEKRNANLENQNSRLRARNNTLSDEGQRLQGDVADQKKTIADKDKEITDRDKAIADIEKAMAEKDREITERAGEIAALSERLDQMEKEREANEATIAALNVQLDQMEKEREETEAAYQEALAQIEEYKAQTAIAQATLDQANTPDTQAIEEGESGSAFKAAPFGQSRNIVGIKIGASDIDLEATFALMPHWFLIADIGAVETADDFVEEEFPGLSADHSFVYTAMFGAGFNWRFENIQGQPNLYIATMLGPAWYRYVYKSDDREGINTYLLWRSSVGFDLTLYKNLQFTTDLSFDYMKNYGFTPHLTVGLQWSFSNSWAAFGGK
ncbi:MAG: DUF481 domain-containing protein [Spirochaetia bacterium]|nr:DUF481 domain-containing protein [Spirochaetia bacterium]